MNILNILLYLLVELYCVFCVIYCYSNSTDRSLKENFSTKKIGVLVAGDILFFINNIWSPTEIRTLCSLIIMCIINKFYFKDDTKKVLINTLIFIMIVTISELIFTPILLFRYENISVINKTPIIKTLYTLIVLTIVNLIYSNSYFKKGVRKAYEILKNVISIEIVLTLIVIVLNIMTYVLGGKINSYHNIIVISIIVIYIIVTFINILKNKINIQKLKIKNRELERLYKSYSQSFEDYRELKHNLKNDLFSIKITLPKAQQKLMNDIIIKYDKKNEWINDLNEVPSGLQGVLYLKSQEAENKGVKMMIHYDSKVTIKRKDFLDICEILNIFIDNAVEASKKTNKIVLVDISDKKDYMNINIINNFSNSINTSKIGDRNYSTKEEKSGIGLNYVLKNKNKSIKNNLKIINNNFIANITYKQ